MNLCEICGESPKEILEFCVPCYDEHRDLLEGTAAGDETEEGAEESGPDDAASDDAATRRVLPLNAGLTDAAADDAATQAHVLGLVSVQISYARTVNFAMEQNSVPIVRMLRVENSSATRLKSVAVRVSVEPDMTPADAAFHANIGALDAGAQYHIDDIDLVLPAQKLVNVTEREKASLRVQVQVSPAGSSDTKTMERVLPLELLAYNEWNASTALPEILAAFVQPGHPVIERLAMVVGNRLQSWTGDASLSEYQSRDPERVYHNAAAVYAALQEVGIRYVTVPPSFERVGQKIRTPDQVMDSKQGNCLDISVLEAACLEYCGLHPVVVIVKGHAFAGVWLTNDSMPEPAVFDASRLRKRVALGEMVFFDSSPVTQQPAVDFKTAEVAARAMLKDDDGFLYAIDIGCARNHRIRPLPSRLRAQTFASVDSGLPSRGVTDPPDFVVPGVSGASRLTQGPREPAPVRLERWKTRLLDLSLRNTRWRSAVRSFTPSLSR